MRLRSVRIAKSKITSKSSHSYQECVQCKSCVVQSRVEKKQEKKKCNAIQKTDKNSKTPIDAIRSCREKYMLLDDCPSGSIHSLS
jgi:transglutaminase/protease-like cytokinesis protein 3